MGSVGRNNRQKFEHIRLKLTPILNTREYNIKHNEGI